MGRHLKYTPKIVDALADDLDSFVKSYEAKGLFPTKSRFASLHSLSREQLTRFTDTKSPTYNEKFFYALKNLEAIQEANLVENALAGKYNASFSIFTAKNVLGWRDEQYIKGEGFNQIFNIVVPKDYKPKNPKNRILNELQAAAT